MQSSGFASASTSADTDGGLPGPGQYLIGREPTARVAGEAERSSDLTERLPFDRHIELTARQAGDVRHLAALEMSHLAGRLDVHRGVQ
jgi:hypothetical protein